MYRLNSFSLCLPLIPLLCSVAMADQDSRHVDAPCPSIELIDPGVDSKDATLAVKWKRAVDQDDSEELWSLLPRVDISKTNDKGKTAIMAAAKLGDHCLIAELQKHGLNIHTRSYTGGTTLMYAVLGNNESMIDYVLDHTDDIDAQSTNGWTAAMIAAAKGFDDVIVQLAAAGADIDFADVYGWSPLMRAIDNRHAAVVDFLLRQPSLAIDRRNENGSSALHIAATVGDISAVRQLLALGADTDALDENDFSPADIAVQKDYPEIAGLISNHD